MQTHCSLVVVYVCVTCDSKNLPKSNVRFGKVATVWLVLAEAGVCQRQLETQVTHFLSSQGCSSELRVSLKRAASRHMSTWELCACHSNRQVSSEVRALRQIECMEWLNAALAWTWVQSACTESWVMDVEAFLWVESGWSYRSSQLHFSNQRIVH